MKPAGALLVAMLGFVSQADVASALGVIETPARLGTESGIGVFSGWHCEAGTIEIRIDEGQAMQAGSGTPRGDTKAVCGRTDTGWSLLYNFSLLDPTVRHEAVAYADGREFARLEFWTTNFGVEYLRGRPVSCEVLNFPELGDRTTLAWNEERQGFSIVSSSAGPTGGLPAPKIAGTYHGAVTEHLATRPPTPATFTVALTDSLLTLTIHPVGRAACTVSLPWEREGTGIVARRFPEIPGCSIRGPYLVAVDGKRIYGSVINIGGLFFEGIKVGG